MGQKLRSNVLITCAHHDGPTVTAVIFPNQLILVDAVNIFMLTFGQYTYLISSLFMPNAFGIGAAGAATALVVSYALLLAPPCDPSIVVMVVTATLLRKQINLVLGYLDARCARSSRSLRLGASPSAANSLPSVIIC